MNALHVETWPALSLSDPGQVMRHLREHGFCRIRLASDRLHETLLNRTFARVKERCRSAVADLEDFPPGDYHRICADHGLDHGSLWLKEARVYHWPEISEVFDEQLTLPLRATFNRLALQTPFDQGLSPSREPYAYFRLIRPGVKADAVHPHADVWTQGAIGFERRTLKIWIPLLGCGPGASFRLMPGSHKRDFAFDPVLRKTPESPFNIFQPLPDQGIETREIVVEPPDVLIFHRKLIHGGMANRTKTTRYSAEITALVEHEDYFDLL